MIGRTLKLAAVILAATVASAITAGAASAGVIYNNIPSPLPTLMSSQGFQSGETSEFGGQVQLAGTARKNPSVKVALASWGCQKGSPYWIFNEGTRCKTAMGAKFSEPITLNIYAVEPSNAPGALLKTVTQTFQIPFRPSASNKCTGGQLGDWYHPGNCFIGRSAAIRFANLGITLPEKVIISIAYNTSGYGSAPYGYNQPCNSVAGGYYEKIEGCGYDWLNVAVHATPSLGSDPLPESAYINSQLPASYCENESAVGTFAESKETPGNPCQEGWINGQPAFVVSASK